MSGAPLPLLGTFHELALTASELRASVEFYERLGFTQATTTDTLSHPYGVLSDGRLFVGLHGRGGPAAVLTFVRRDVAQAIPGLSDAGIELTVSRTGEEVFNEIGFEDPFGNAVAVLEARTYSPPDRSPTDTSGCGDFAEVSLPASDFGAARAFWEPLGFVAAEESVTPYPRLSLTSDHIDIAFHSPRLCDRAMLVFQDATMPGRIARLRQAGVSFSAAPRALAAVGALLLSPEGTALLLLGAEG
jgi:catechol 2,3-dioxygenase-like lactoylglutathione lyase family enzyme